MVSQGQCHFMNKKSNTEGMTHAADSNITWVVPCFTEGPKSLEINTPPVHLCPCLSHPHLHPAGALSLFDFCCLVGAASMQMRLQPTCRTCMARAARMGTGASSAAGVGYTRTAALM